MKSYELFYQMYIKSTPQILQAIMRKTVNKTMQQRFQVNFQQALDAQSTVL